MKVSASVKPRCDKCRVIKRKGVYYLMWSEGGWTGPDYSVAYAMGPSPTGPFKPMGKILAQDFRIARGAGHQQRRRHGRREAEEAMKAETHALLRRGRDHLDAPSIKNRAGF